MGAKSKAGKAGSAVAAARTSPYVQRLVDDAELRDNIRVAFESARGAYDRLNNGKTPGKVLLDDKKFQKELRKASDAARDASIALREGKKRKRGGLGRKLLVLVIGTGVAMAASEGLRSKVLDTLFGKEEEFDYTSTTAPATPPPPAAKPTESAPAS